MFNRSILLAFILLFQAGLSHAGSGLDIYVVRHAQTVANASGVKDKRSDSTFSDEGRAQVDTLTRELLNYRFDAVLVSPTERTLNTIHPYLQQGKTVGIVWPELTECCWQQDRGAGEAGQLVTGSVLQLEPEIAPQFSFRDSSSAFKYANRNYADGVAQVRQAVSLLKSRYSDSGKTILIVTHYHAGAVLLGELLGVSRDSLPGLENARLTHLRQEKDGRFTLLTINGKPY
ncbi:MAG TPA: histidine phosphatase family protein [Gallionella sp.]|nr:histidine phosphatase family protein [Gallionella sp.]